MYSPLFLRQAIVNRSNIDNPPCGHGDLFNPFNQAHKDGDGYWPDMQLVTGVVPANSGANSTFADFSTSRHGARTIRMRLMYSF